MGKNRKRRADLILTNGKEEALIFNVTIPFDNGLETFNDARAEKIKKISGCGQGPEAQIQVGY